MFKFLRERKAERDACTKIGVELHRQIRQAFESNESETGIRLRSFFTVGYLYSFVRIGFVTLGINGEQATDKHLKYICDGVIPKRLYDIFSRMLASLELAKSMDNKTKVIPGSDITPPEAITQFEIGMAAGAFDADCFRSLSDRKTDNLKKYLLGEKLEYSPLPD